MQLEQDSLNQELKDLEYKYHNGLDTFKLTRQQKRKVFKQDKFSNRIKQLLK
jgi:hypothetical protein